MVVRAPAKVNLFLEILARRPDGYHEIATLMVAISLYDTLEFKEEPSGAIQLSCDVPNLSCGPDNLVYRAAEVLRRETGCTRGATIRLTKRIPMAAGLAGGSTDAAAALHGLNRLWRLGRDRSALARLGAQLGSDIPFFFHTPSAFCTGRGEVVKPVALGRSLDLVLLCPPFGLATAEVYRHLTVPMEPRAGDEVVRALESGDIGRLGKLLHNRLEEPAFQLRPDLRAELERLRSLGPVGQLMSGSGSTLFALCRSADEAQHLVRQLRDTDKPDALRPSSAPPDEAAGDRSRFYVVRSSS